MALPDTRHRARYLLVAVVVGHILLISAQVSSRSGSPLLQAALMTTLTTLQHAAWTVVSGVRGAWEGYAYLRGVTAENQRLAREKGMRTMFEDGLIKAVTGRTTLEELLRVTRLDSH